MGNILLFLFSKKVKTNDQKADKARSKKSIPKGVKQKKITLNMNDEVIQLPSTNVQISNENPKPAASVPVEHKQRQPRQNSYRSQNQLRYLQESAYLSSLYSDYASNTKHDVEQASLKHLDVKLLSGNE